MRVTTRVSVSIRTRCAARTVSVAAYPSSMKTAPAFAVSSVKTSTSCKLQVVENVTKQFSLLTSKTFLFVQNREVIWEPDVCLGTLSESASTRMRSATVESASANPDSLKRTESAVSNFGVVELTQQQFIGACFTHSSTLLQDRRFVSDTRALRVMFVRMTTPGAWMESVTAWKGSAKTAQAKFVVQQNLSFSLHRLQCSCLSKSVNEVVSLSVQYEFGICSGDGWSG